MRTFFFAVQLLALASAAEVFIVSLEEHFAGERRTPQAGPCASTLQAHVPHVQRAA